MMDMSFKNAVPLLSVQLCNHVFEFFKYALYLFDVFYSFEIVRNMHFAIIHLYFSNNCTSITTYVKQTCTFLYFLYRAC